MTTPKGIYTGLDRPDLRTQQQIWTLVKNAH